MVDVDACRSYVPDGLESWTDDEVQEALDTELADQESRTTYVGDVQPAPLASMLKRRVMINLAWRSRTFATDVVGDAEIAVNLPANDPVVRRYEAQYRKVRLGT